MRWSAQVNSSSARMTLMNKSKTFASLREGIDWVRSLELPRLVLMSIGAPEEFKQMLRESGCMSAAGRALMFQATGASFESKVVRLRSKSVRVVLRKGDRRSRRKVLAQ